MPSLVELVTQGLNLVVGDGAMLGFSDLDEFTEVVTLDLAGDGSRDVGRQSRGATS
ncbi:hypothetical protein [Herbidospora mongoliensis]|uniref:hypothetical protein n=1 Tax=Herbidospora mongoliensis TaxID=688067 RepID=UPI000AA15052|nr:hypothetical protein [Herbidospora mongoliensis]